MNQNSIGGDNLERDKVAGDKIGRDLFKDITITAEFGSAVSLGGDAIVNNINISDRDAARYQHTRTHLLERLQATWIQGVLENSLFEVTRLELGLASQPDAVERPWVMSLERPNTPSHPLPPTSKILDTYHALNGSMLILGSPGSGKTTTLLELARELRHLALKSNQQPIPLVFNLASWTITDERKELHNIMYQWLTDELLRIYDVGRQQAEGWLKTMPYHLLLDGLDEVKPHLQEKCITAINDFRNEYGPINLVVSCRTEDYLALNNPLHLLGAVVIQPLTPTQIHQYLSAVNPHLAQIVNEDQTLNELSQTPLTLNIIALAYRETEPETLLAGTVEERRKQLFQTYIDRMFSRRGETDLEKKRKSISYLVLIASQVRTYGQSLFYIRTIQVDALGRHARSYVLLSFLVFSLIGGLSFGLLLRSAPDPILQWTAALLGGLASGRLLGLNGGIGQILLPKSLLRASRSFSRTSWLLHSVLGLSTVNYMTIRPSLFLWSLKTALPGGLLGGFIGGTLGGLPGGLIAFIMCSLLGGLTGGWRIGALGGLSIGLSSGLLGVQTTGFPDKFIISFLSGLIYVLFHGGDHVIKHYLLRGLLHVYKYLPLKLGPFLDEMTSRLILRKVGGSYIFIHRMLLEYFAGLEPEESQAPGLDQRPL